MASSESPLNLVRGPAKAPEWAQLIRLGGDRVAILFGELRKAVGQIEGIIERLHYSSSEARWVVKYCAGGTELFTVRISPRLLVADMPLSRLQAETLLGARGLSGTINKAIRSEAWEAGSELLRLPLTNRRLVRSFANLVKAKDRLLSSAAKPIG